MKTIIEPKQPFTPRTVTMTFETERELRAFYAIINATGSDTTASHAIETSGDVSFPLQPLDIMNLGSTIFNAICLPLMTEL